MKSPRPAIIANRKHELGAGVIALCLSSWLIYDSYEGRGVKRPWWTRLLPGA